jgi:hypothetical protein
VAAALLLALLPAAVLGVERSSTASELRSLLSRSGGLSVESRAAVDAQGFDAFQGRVSALVDSRMARYLDGAAEEATVGPLPLDPGRSPDHAPLLASASVTVAYVSDLEARVEPVEGQLSGAAVAGSGTVSMPQVVADRMGVRLFDQLCVQGDGGGSSTPWCARVVGLWRPTAAADPRWTAAGAEVTLFTGRTDLFSLLALRPAQTIGESRRYRARAAAITLATAGDLRRRLQELEASVGARRLGTVRASLDGDLDRYAAARAQLVFDVELLALALALLAVLLVAVLGRWYVESRRHELALLRARGWSRGDVRRLLLAQLAILGLPCLVVLAAALLALATSGAQLPAGGAELVVVAAAPLLLSAGCLAWLAWRAARRDGTPADRPDADADAALTAGRLGPGALAILPAALLLLLQRAVLEAGRWPAPGALSALNPLLSVAALVLLVVASIPVLSALVEALGRGRADLEGTLARWQLRRWWRQHAGAGFVMVLGFAIAALAAVAFAHQELDRPGSSPSLPHGGATVSLAVAFAGALAAALLAGTLAMLLASRSRREDYAALLLDGLQVDALSRSLQVEQRTVLGVGVAAGLGLGLALFVVDSVGLPLPGASGAGSGLPSGTAALVGLLATAALALLPGAALGWLVRRTAVGFDLLRHGYST